MRSEGTAAMAIDTNHGGRDGDGWAAARVAARHRAVTDRLERPLLVVPRPASAAHRPTPLPPRRPCAADRPRDTHPSAARPALAARPAPSAAEVGVGRGGPAVRRPVARPDAASRRHARARRSAAVGLIAFLLATCAVWVQGGGGRTGSGPLAAPGAGRTEAVAAHLWVVQPGDTLWNIARHLQPTGDIRPLVDALSAEVHGRPLQVGQQLRLP